MSLCWLGGAERVGESQSGRRRLLLVVVGLALDTRRDVAHPKVTKGPVRVVERAAAMEVDTDAVAGGAGGGDDELDPAEARLRRVMGSVTGYAIKKPRQQLKKAAMAQFGVHGGVHGPGKRRLAAMKKAIKRGSSAGGAR